MITDTFDGRSEEIIKVWRNENAPKVDACIVTFSREILQRVVENHGCELLGNLWSSNGANPVYRLEYGGKTFAVYMSYVSAPACVADMEDTLSVINTDKFVVFGGAGCLNKDIARGRVMVPTEAYRDEGTSYHYAPAADYIAVKNSAVVAQFMESAGLPYVTGRTWTTDAFHRETRDNFEKRKADGCISVEMECAAVQAMCDFRGLQAYFFFTGGDLLDAPEWDRRMSEDEKRAPSTTADILTSPLSWRCTSPKNSNNTEEIRRQWQTKHTTAPYTKDAAAVSFRIWNTPSSCATSRARSSV